MTEVAFQISVVIPAYNAEKYIARAVESVLKQTRPADEIIVVDDGSTDKTADMVRAFGDRVRLIQQPNAGVSAARNAGIRAARGNWIAFLDADDEWLPEKLELQLAHLQKHPQLAWTSGNYFECLCSENRIAECIDRQTCRKWLDGSEFFDSYFHAVQKNLLGHTNCMLINRQVFDKIGLFDVELPIAEDLDMWLRIAYVNPQVGFLCQPLAIYHLTVCNSLMVSSKPQRLYAEFMQRHFRMARAQGCMQTFLPAARAIMHRWIRGMLFRGRSAEIRELLKCFPEAFSLPYRTAVHMLTACPGLTERLLRFFSKVVRKLRLRRKLTRPPATGR